MARNTHYRDEIDPGRKRKRRISVTRARGHFASLFLLTLSWGCHNPVTNDLPPEPIHVYREWRSFTTRDGLPDDRITALRVFDGQVWVGTAGGLALREDGRWSSWTPGDGLPYAAVSAIDVDSVTRDVWLGTWGGGLVRFTAGRFDSFNQFNSGLAGDLVFAVTVADGRVWAATNAGVSAFDPIADTWELYAERRADAPETAITRLVARGDCLYGAAWCQGPWRLDLEEPRASARAALESHVDTKSVSQNPCGSGVPPVVPPAGSRCHKPGETTLSLAAAGRALWWATQTHLFRKVGDGAWVPRRIEAGGTTPGLVHCLAALDENRAMLGTDHGLLVLSDWASNTWIVYRRGGISSGGRIVGARTMQATLPDDRVRCIALAGHEVWVGTANGLALGTNPGPWRVAPPAGVDGAATPEQAADRTAQDRVAKHDSERSRPATLAVIGPVSRVVALPGAASQPSRKSTMRADLLAVQLAVGRANRRGEPVGRERFVLAASQSGYSRYAWGTPEDDLVLMAGRDEVLGVVGRIEPGSRIASAAAFRTEVPLVNAAATPATVDETINPWVFRCRVNDPRRHWEILDYGVDALGAKRVAVVSTGAGPMEQLHLDWWRDRARERGVSVVADVAYDPEAGEIGPVLAALRRHRPDAVLTWGDADVSVMLLRRFREAGVDAAFVGSDRIVCDRFAALAGGEPGVVLAPAPCGHRRDTEGLQQFIEDYTIQGSPARFRRQPPLKAFLSYDAAGHLMEAIAQGGRDREAVRQALRDMGGAVMARLEKGRWETVPLHEVPHP